MVSVVRWLLHLLHCHCMQLQCTQFHAQLNAMPAPNGGCVLHHTHPAFAWLAEGAQLTSSLGEAAVRHFLLAQILRCAYIHHVYLYSSRTHMHLLLLTVLHPQLTSHSDACSGKRRDGRGVRLE